MIFEKDVELHTSGKQPENEPPKGWEKQTSLYKTKTSFFWVLAPFDFLVGFFCRFTREFLSTQLDTPYG